jgi:putative sterol carrier protein
VSAPENRTFSTAAEVFAVMPEELTAERIDGTQGVLCFEIRDAGTWTLTLEGDAANVAEGEPPSFDVRITTDEQHWLAIAEGRASARRLFMSGKVKVKGRLPLAIKLDKLLAPAA